MFRNKSTKSNAASVIWGLCSISLGVLSLCGSALWIRDGFNSIIHKEVII